MQRVTLTIDDGLLGEIDAFMAARGQASRSEALRDLARAGLATLGGNAASGPCVAALVYVFDHETRELARRLTHHHHDHHDLTLATTHVHLDGGTCLEVSLLKGPAEAVRHLADHVSAERGVRHGRLVLIPVESDDAVPDHRHDDPA